MTAEVFSDVLCQGMRVTCDRLGWAEQPHLNEHPNMNKEVDPISGRLRMSLYHVNGQPGTLREFDAASGKWRVELLTGHPDLFLGPSNLSFLDDDVHSKTLKVLPMLSFAESVLQSLVHQRMLRILSPEEIRDLCECFEEKFRRRGIAVIFGWDVFQILDHLYYFAPQDIWADPGKFAPSEPLHIWAYRKTSWNRAPALCECPDPATCPPAGTNLFLIAMQGGCNDSGLGTIYEQCYLEWKEHADFCPEFWRWISAADLRDGLLEDPSIALWSHCIYTVEKPTEECRDAGQTSPIEDFEDWQRCNRCRCYSHRRMFTGASRTCTYCCKNLWTCSVCASEALKEAFSPGQWKHRHERGARCLSCEPAVTHTCDECHAVKPAACFSASVLKNRWSQRTVCLECEQDPAKEQTLQCQLCGARLTSQGFVESMWHHKKDAQRFILCKGCCRPPCTNAECTTCTKCRDPECTKRRHCEADLKSLHPQCLPRAPEELETWLCAKCKPTFCSHWPECTQKRTSKKVPAREQFTCRQCLQTRPK